MKYALRLSAMIIAVALAGGCALKIEGGGTAPVVAEDVPTGDAGDTTTPEETDIPDNSALPTCECKAPYCRTEGVCKAAQPKCVQNEDGTCAWDCDLPENYVEAEGDGDCDLEDNDCDGVIDDVPERASDTVTCADGVCLGAPSRCVNGAWVCDKSNVAGYEKVETECDKLDNDCNGQADQDLKGNAGNCDFVGVCAQVVDVVCTNGQWECTAARLSAPHFEADEISCDGLDNDCDGDVDEGLTGTSTEACVGKGLCAGAVGVAATCTAGKWSCDYSAIVGHEAAGETLCDDKDNDCDGLTDNDLPALNFEDCDSATKAKASAGVCKQKAAVLCLGGQVNCTFDYIVGYEPTETACDGIDNDCDGLTDENLTPPAGFCALKGVCDQAVTATCDSLGAKWVCNPAGVPGYEATEQTCDNKDNDCDGLTDEGIVLPASECPATQEGVCKNKPLTVTCAAGQPVCSLSSIAGYQATETTCDGLDNDCDGATDEGIGGKPEDVAASTCLKAGVCADANKVLATCAAGKWSCEYTALGGVFQAGTETLCDNKDNDCDGLIDENISGAGIEGCNKGVCSGKTSATCVGGVYKCDVGAVIGFENPEASCDGKDNNCDGATDEGACGPLAGCAKDADCKSGRCRETPDGKASCCISKDGECPTAECAALAQTEQTGCLLVDVGNGPEFFTTHCRASGWESDPVDDLCEAGACSDGACRSCVPGTRVCDELGTAIVECNDEGEYSDESVSCPPEEPAPTCKAGFPGACLRHEDQQLRTSVDPVGFDSRNAFPLRVTPSTHFAVWQNLSAVGATTYALVGRTTDSFARPTAQFSNLQPAGTAGQPAGVTSAVEPRAVKVTTAASVATWREIAGTETGNIRLRVFSNTTGAGLTQTIFANQNKNFEQGFPTIAKGAGASIVAVWETTADPNGAGKDIAVRGFTLNGNTLTPASGAEKLANAATPGDQKRPAAVGMTDGIVIVAWEDDGLDSPVSVGSYARRFDLAQPGGGAFIGSAFALHKSQQGDQKEVALGARSAGFVASWTSNHGTGGDDVYVRTFGADGKPISDEVLVSKQPNGEPLPGAQAHSDVTMADDGSIVVVYDDVVGDVSGGSIQMMQYDSQMIPIGDIRRVNDTQIAGNQRSPRVSPGVDSLGTHWALVAFESEGANGAGISGVFLRPMVLQLPEQ